MNWLTWIVFESPAALGVVLVVPLFGLLVLWRRGGQARPVLIGLALAAALFVAQAVVVTNREHAGRVLADIEKELLASRTTALAAALAPDFRFDQLDGDEFLAFVRQGLGSVRIHWVERVRLEVQEAAADRFVVRADYLAEVNTNGVTHVPRSAWTLTFIRAGDRWLVAELRCLHIDGLPDLFRV
jgi:hypothetical protein